MASEDSDQVGERVPAEVPAPWTLTAAELADQLVRGDGLDDEPVEIVLALPGGRIVYEGICYLSVGTGEDFDRSGGYRWRRIFAQLDEIEDPRPADAGQVVDDNPGDGAGGPF